MRPLTPVMEQMHRRANPASCDIVEISAPDQGYVLRRAVDQFFSTPPRVSEAPANSSAADSAGALALTGTANQIASLYVDGGGLQLGGHDPSTQIYGLWWNPDRAFGRAILRSFTARMERDSNNGLALQLQIYRAIAITFPSGLTAFDLAFVPLLPEPIFIKHDAIGWVANKADVKFDLSRFRLEVHPGPEDPTGPGAGFNPFERPGYYFTVHPVNPSKFGQMSWRNDTTSARDVAGIGTFVQRQYDRPTSDSRWSLTQNAYCPMFKLEIESFAVSSTIVYSIPLPGAPLAASIGRVVFERALPVGTAATLDLSTAGAGGPWTAVKHGDVVAVRQQNYHLKAVLTSDAAHRMTPRVSQVGIEYRTPIDVSAEMTIEPVSHAADLPWCKGHIGEGRVNVLRTGRRDFRDKGSDLATGSPTSKLEIDHYLGSRHPKATRDHWLLIDRSQVNDRTPTGAAESFGVLSALKLLKRKVPGRIETISQVLKVVAPTTASQITVDQDLQGASGAGAYAAKGYYLRVRSSTQVGVGSGFIATIDNNSALRKLDFTNALPGTLAVDDVIEVHSGVYAQPILQWFDTDPADIWWELLTVHLGIAPEKIGFGNAGAAGRSGLPPKVSDRAPGDLATQAMLKVTTRLKEVEDCDQLIDQVSFLLGGVTVAIAGQICFRQIYPLRDASGAVTVSAGASVRTFDPRDWYQLDTPAGTEKRITVLACDYGIDLTTLASGAPPADTVNFVDADALAWLATQDVDGLGSAVVDTKIARWCFNSADQGKFLATQLAQQVVNACSTGLRIWSWSAVEAHPDLDIGDVVTVITDGYTDYDPTRRMRIRGWWAFSVVLVGKGGGGRRFAGFLLGLGGAAQVKGGVGTLTAVDDPTVVAAGLRNLKFTDSSDGTQRTFTAIAGSFVDRVFIYDTLAPAPPSTDPWPSDGRLPDQILTPDPVTGLISYTTVKPSNGFQRFIQFEPRHDDHSSGKVYRSIVDPTQASMAPKISANVSNNFADLVVDVIAGPADWPVQVDVFEDDPNGAAIFSGSYSANIQLDKTSIGASALGARVLTNRPLRRWWVRLTNIGGQVDWASCSSDRNVVPMLESLSLLWDEAGLQLRARVKGAVNCQSCLVEISTSSSFTAPTTSTLALTDGADLTATFALIQSQRGQKWYARATPYNAPALGGNAGVSMVKELYVPVVPFDGQEIAQGTIAIDAAGVPTAVIDLPAWAVSAKYATSTSSQPTDAAALAGTTASGRQFAVAGSALSIGATFYITVIPFSAASAAGYQGPSIRLRATRHDFSATKTVQFAAYTLRAKNPNATTQPQVSSDGGIHVAASGAFTGDLVREITIPDGVTITAVAADVYAGSGDPLHYSSVKIELFRVKNDGTAPTSLGSVTKAGTEGGGTDGYQNGSFTISESTTGRRYQYAVTLFTQPTSAPGSANIDAAVYSCSYTYTMPSSDKSI